MINIEEELHYCLFIFEVLGLQYFSLKNFRCNDFKTQKKVHRFLYMVFLLLLMNSLTTLFIANEHEIIVKGEINAKNVLMFAVQHTMDVGFLLVICASLIQSFVTTENVKKIFFNTKEILQLSMTEFKMTIDLREMRRTVWKRLVAMVIFILTVHGTLMIFHKDRPEAILQLFFGVLPVFFLDIVVFKFVFYVGMVNSQLEFLGNLLEKVFKNEPIKIVDNINFYVTSVKPTKPYEDPLKRLRVIWKIYNQVYENGILVNESLGLTILIMITSLVITLTVSGYEVFVILIGGIRITRLPETVYTLVIANAVIFTVVGYCQETQRIMSKLATSLKKLECENYEKLSNETRDFMRSFYLQLMHQPVIFTAFGMYAINMTLIASITTEIVSYQIILVQFYAS